MHERPFQGAPPPEEAPIRWSLFTAVVGVVNGVGLVMKQITVTLVSTIVLYCGFALLRYTNNAASFGTCYERIVKTADEIGQMKRGAFDRSKLSHPDSDLAQMVDSLLSLPHRPEAENVDAIVLAWRERWDLAFSRTRSAAGSMVQLGILGTVAGAISMLTSIGEGSDLRESLSGLATAFGTSLAGMYCGWFLEGLAERSESNVDQMANRIKRFLLGLFFDGGDQ